MKKNNFDENSVFFTAATVVESEVVTEKTLDTYPEMYY